MGSGMDWRSHSDMARACALSIAMLALSAWPAPAMEVTFRLVRADAPGQLVSTAVTRIDVAAERAAAKEKEEAKTALARALGTTSAALPIPEKEEETRPKAEFDRYSNYMRGIVIDNRHPFHRTYKGSYLGRTDVLTLSLDDGDHVIEPGGHRFRIAEGTITSDDSSLRIDATSVEVTLYPVTVIAIDGGALRKMPAEVLRLPVAPRLYWGTESLLPREKLLAENATFKRLTLYMLANRGSTPYRLTPSRRSFHVGESGVVIVGSDGLPARDRSVYVEGRFTVVIPKVPMPVVVRGQDLQVLITGEAGSFRLNTKGRREAKGVFYAVGALAGATITAGCRAQSAALEYHGDVGDFPRRKLIVDATAAGTREPRLFLPAVSQYCVPAGAQLRVRVQFQDALDADTVEPADVTAWLCREPVLQDNGLLRSAPTPDTPLDEWRNLRVSSTDKPDVYRVLIPSAPSSVYWLRLAVSRRGVLSPATPLHADCLIGISNPESPATLSLFAPRGRHAFVQGADLPVSVVLKTPAKLPPNTLRVVLKQNGRAWPLTEEATLELAPGAHPFHYVIDGEATTALAPGDYALEASHGELRSNNWVVRVSRPRYREDFPHFAQSFGAPTNIHAGSPYVTVPRTIAEANEMRETLRRTAGILSRQDTINLMDGLFDRARTRDSTSEVAQVEMILRQGLSLPAHETYYCQSVFEASLEWLAWEGMGQYCHSACPFIVRSVVHSVPKEVNARRRHFQLTAQGAEGFENCVGMSLVRDDTCPTGDSEVGDAGRTLRLANQLKSFGEKHGFGPPPMRSAQEFIEGYTQGRDTAPFAEAGEKQWPAWMVEQSHLLSDYYRHGREAVEPIRPGLCFGTQGPGWGGTLSGGYPPLAHQHQTPLTVQIGTGDYAHKFILDNLVGTRFFRMSGRECWGTISHWGGGGFYNLKNYVAGFLAAGAKGLGYYCGWRGELGNPNTHRSFVWQEERQDIRDILQAYGPMLRQLDPRAEIAVFYGYHQSMYDLVLFTLPRPAGLYTRLTVYSAITQLALQGYNCEVLTEEMIDAGALDRFKVVLAPGFIYARPRHLDAFDQFIQRGGRFLVGSTSTLLPKGAQKIDDDFLECGSIHVINSGNGLLDLFDDGHAWLFAEARRKSRVLRAAIEPVHRPFARAETDRVLVQTSRAGDGRYTFVWNALYPSWAGTNRVSPSTKWSMYAEAFESSLVPLKETVTFPAGRHTYELFSQEAIAASGAAQADLSFTPFRIFVSLPEPIVRLRVEAPESVAIGTRFPVRVTPLGPSGKPINACIPITLALSDAQGRYVQGRPAASFPIAEAELTAPLGSAPGVWRVTVKELVSGRSATVPLTVKPRARAAAPVTKLPPADVQRERLVRQFLADRKQDGEPVWILLGESQWGTRGSLAKAAASALERLGINATVRRTDEPGVFCREERVHLYRNWQDMAPYQYIDSHVLLIGGEGESVLIEELMEKQLLVRPLTASYPGPGRGVVCLVRSPFAYGRDVLGLFGPDDAGLRAAIAKLSALGTPAPEREEPAPMPLVARELEGDTRPGTPFTNMDGAPCQQIAVRRDGQQIAFGVLGYAKNLFVFDPTGELLYEDKLGHVNTQRLQFLDDGRVALGSDGATYLRLPDGSIPWRARDGNAKIHVDEGGRYFVRRAGNGFEVRDLERRLLWKFDEWEQCATTAEILLGRRAVFLGVSDQGNTVVYRRVGKEPGLAGAYGDDIVYADALTGQERRVVPLDTAALRSACGVSGAGAVSELALARNGECVIARVRGRRRDVLALLDRDFKLTQRETMKTPVYLGGTSIKMQKHLLADNRLLFSIGDMLCVSDAQWASCKSVRTEHLILTFAVDETRGQVAVSNYAGELRVLDLDLEPIWQARLDSAAQLAFLPDRRLAVGTLRGRALLFGPDGRELWRRSLNRYAPPEVVEQRWTEMEAIPSLQSEGDEPWWERLERNIELGSDIAKLSGTVSRERPLTGTAPAEVFGTYLVEWKIGASRVPCTLSLDAVEIEKGQRGETPRREHRLTRSSPCGGAERIVRALLRLGDRPDLIETTIRAAGEAEVVSTVTIRPLAFPSESHIRMPSLYRGQITEAERTNPPVAADIFFNVAGAAPHTTRRVEPLAFVNGRMFEEDAALSRGKWFGGPVGGAKGKAFTIVPCWIELTLPQKKVVTHVVVAEDHRLERVTGLSVDVYVESRETRKGLSAFEKRQLKRGFWYNVVKQRGNTDVYHVFRLEKPVYTRQLRVYVLSGYPSITEIELYGALRKEMRKE